MRKKIKIINQSGYKVPGYATPYSSGIDLPSNERVIIEPGQRELVKTGYYLEIPRNMEAQIRPRSGMAIKYGVTVLNTPGTIDFDYRGEIGVILYNTSDQSFRIKPGQCIAQMVFQKIKRVELVEKFSLRKSKRGNGGFGSTDK